MSSGVVQQVFESLSLRSNVDLWMSDEEDRFEERVEYLAAFPEAAFADALSKSKQRSAKQEGLAKGFLDKAANLLEDGQDLNKALMCLDRALVLGQEDDTLDRAYALRSQALFKCGRFRECVRDTEQVRQVQADVLATRCEAMAASGDRVGAEKCLEEILKEFGKEREILRDLQKVVDSAREVKSAEVEVEVAQKGFGPKVEVREAPGRGRYLVATEAVAAGELLATDGPGAMAMPDPGFESSHCWHCLRTVGGPGSVIPCRECSAVVFCSAQCRREAWNRYHSVECGVTALLLSANVGVWALAFRGAVCSAHAGADCLEGELDLVAHLGMGALNAPELMKEALVALFFLRLMRHGREEAGAEDRTALGDEDLEAARLLRRLMRIAQFNSHEVVGSCPEEPRVIGSAVNPLLALINHSCDANYGRVWIHRRDEDGLSFPVALAYATRDVTAGEEVTDCYSSTFAAADREERTAVHARYLFECGCDACSHDWPTQDRLPFKVKGLNKDRYNNKKAADKDKVARLSSLVSGSKDRFENLDKCKEIVSLSGTLLKRPHGLQVASEDALHKALRMRDLRLTQ